LTVSEVAFKPNPQYMEKCNIRVLSEGYKRKKKETPTPIPTPTPEPALAAVESEPPALKN
ncbi:MAG: hypothetical protein MUF15_25575, partial [Acidobacteria bacterium]|nr:hypothetical protein [Acidobacteriota bacterium]